MRGYETRKWPMRMERIKEKTEVGVGVRGLPPPLLGQVEEEESNFNPEI